MFHCRLGRLARHMSAMVAGAGEKSIHRRVPVVIVGSGPSGLTAGIYAGRAGLTPVIAAGSVKGTALPGGQLMITTDVSNFPGFPDDISGPELIDRMFQQAKRFGCEVIEQFATDFVLKPGGPHEVLIGDKWFACDALILANGASARWLGATGEEKFVNRGISACATCDGPLPIFRNKHIYVVGGGDSACEEAAFLTRFASKVYMIHRRDKLRASKVMADRVLSNPKVEVLWNTTIVSYTGVEKLEGIVLEDTVTKQQRHVSAGGLFMAIGHDPNTGHLKKTGLELDDEGYIVVKNHVFTNIDGVFACGDCHDRTYRQAITASGFGCMAAITAERWLEDHHANMKR
ncbi:Thioredoxin reductase [Plasmodiophora brassicae]|nr:hypothetical protein PBRA_009575 [Plasmodiophora brassicae]